MCSTTIFAQGTSPCGATALTLGINPNGTILDSAPNTIIVNPNPTCGNHITSAGCVDGWYVYTPTSPGAAWTLTLESILGVDRDVGVAVYTSSTDGCSGTFTQVACNNEGTGTFTVNNSTCLGAPRYYFRMWDWACNGDVAFTINLTSTTLPNGGANDNPCGATNLTVGATLGGQSTGGATQTANPGPVPGPCSNGNVGYSQCGLCGDRWYQVTLTTPQATVYTSGGFDMQLAAYTGACGSLNFVTCDSDGGPGLNAEITVNGAVGQVFYFRVWEFNCDVIGTYSITVDADTDILLNAATNGSEVFLNCGTTLDLYDSGGSGGSAGVTNTAGNYGNNENFGIKFTAPVGKVVKIEFEKIIGGLNGEIYMDAGDELSPNVIGNSADFLRIYDGNWVNAQKIGSYTGTTISYPQPGVIISRGRTLSLRMVTNGIDNRAGFHARIYCDDPVTPTTTNINVCNGGQVANFSRAAGGGANAFQIWNYCPPGNSSANGCIFVDFSSFAAEYNIDMLQVYDQSATTSLLPRNLLVTLTSSDNANLTGTISATELNASGCLAFKFQGGTNDANPWVDEAAWSAIINCGPCRLGAGGGDACVDATEFDRDGIWAATNQTAEGQTWNTVSGEDPIIKHPSCAAAEQITRMENTTWFKFKTPPGGCGTDFFLTVDNISCQNYRTTDNGIQIQVFELLSPTTCPANGSFWGDNNHSALAYCKDKLTAGTNVSLNFVAPDTEYYIFYDGFTGQKCNWDMIISGFPSDWDQDGICDLIDIDDDNDGIPDVVELGCAQGTQFGAGCLASDPNDDDDGDGVPNYADPNWASCGGLNAQGICTSFDLDGDGNPNHLDLDADNDGIPDVIEAGGSDPDNDGIIGTGFPLDSDGDGLPNDADIANGDLTTTNLPIANTDSAGNPDYLDLDSDDDGIPDLVEVGGTDANDDGYVDDYDPDAPVNTNPWSDSNPDNDGWSNTYDGDTDNNGTTDQPNSQLVDECLTCLNATNSPINPDGTGGLNHLDLDSDNDGCFDTVEAGGGDSNNDGITGGTTPIVDTDGDGWSNIEDSDDGGSVLPDTDPFSDSYTDESVSSLVCDIDDDNDGIPDVIELCGPGATDFSCIGAGSDPSGDDDMDGTPNYQDPQYCTLNSNGVCDEMDHDGDGVPNHLDLDADNDGIPDVIEGGGSDPDNDGIIGTGTPTDSDRDGLPDDADPDGSSTTNTGTPGQTTLPIFNTDATTDPDFLDLDADDDGIPDLVESGGMDTNDDGYVDDYNPTTGTWIGVADADNDGWSNTYDGDTDNNSTIDNPGNELIVDCLTCSPADDPDGDNAPNHLDLDSDNDGCFDTVEAGGGDSNNDGITGGTTPIVDTDDDGWSNIEDSDNGGSVLPNTNPELDIYTNAAFFTAACDIDDDNDGIPDVIEICGIGATDFSCVGAGSDPNGDDDDDGIPNYQDPDYCTLNAMGVCEEMDQDGDGLPNHLDLDADNDGIPDVIEGGGTDPDNDGIAGTGPPTDSDGDGLPDAADPDDTSPTNTGGPDQTNLPIPNTDGVPGTPDFLDLDSDDDGIPDIVESGGDDTNNDGMADGPNCFNPIDCQPDLNDNGWSDDYDSGAPLIDECLTCDPRVNPDGDNSPNHLDLDSDDDGCFDTVEADLADNDTDDDGIVGATTPINDTDGDGWSDLNDGDNGGTVLANTDPATDLYTDATTLATHCENFLDVELISFVGKEINCAIHLDWVVTEQVEVQEYQIEISLNGIDFRPAGIVEAVDGTGNISYSITLEEIFETNYLRIKMLDLDGTFEYSPTILLNSSCKKLDQIRWVSPIPATTEINVEFNSGAAQEVRLMVTDVIGRRLIEVPVTAGPGRNFETIDVTKLSQGIYFVQIDYGQIVTIPVKFVKQ